MYRPRSSRRSEIEFGMIEECQATHRDQPLYIDVIMRRRCWGIENGGKCGDREIVMAVLRDWTSTIQQYGQQVFETTSSLKMATTDDEKERLKKDLVDLLGIDDAGWEPENWLSNNVDQQWQTVLDVMETRGFYYRIQLDRSNSFITRDHDGNLERLDANLRRSQFTQLRSVQRNALAFTEFPSGTSKGEYLAKMANAYDVMSANEIVTQLYMTRVNKIQKILGMGNNGNGNGNNCNLQIGDGGDGSDGGGESSPDFHADFVNIRKLLRRNALMG